MSRSWLDGAKRVIGACAVIAALAFSATILNGDGKPSELGWGFLEEGTPKSLGLVVHGTGGQWALEEDALATGGRALANHAGEAGARPALIVAAAPRARDLKTRTRCKIVQGAVPTSAASCGVVFRFVDPDNHWIVRADATTSSVEAVVVIGGAERVIRSARTKSPLAIGAWIELGVEVRADVVRVLVDGWPVLVAEAPSVVAAFGAIGLWAPSEATVLFDHFAIELLTPSPQALEILPILGRRQG